MDAHRRGDGYPWPVSGYVTADELPVPRMIEWSVEIYAPPMMSAEHVPWVCPWGTCRVSADDGGRPSVYGPYYWVVTFFGPGHRWSRSYVYVSPRDADELACGVRHHYGVAVGVMGPHRHDVLDVRGAVAA